LILCKKGKKTALEEKEAGKGSAQSERYSAGSYGFEVNKNEIEIPKNRANRAFDEIVRRSGRERQ
jgi:hypothetical protein